MKDMLHKLLVDNNIRLSTIYNSELEKMEVIVSQECDGGYHDIATYIVNNRADGEDPMLDLKESYIGKTKRVEKLKQFLKENDLQLSTDYDGNNGHEYIEIVDSKTMELLDKVTWGIN